jgi:hypothetical protein
MADRRLPSRPVSAVGLVLPRVKTWGDRAVLRRTSRVAVVASYALEPPASRSLIALITEFEAEGYTVVLVRASDTVHRPVWPDTSTISPIVIAKPNIGYDFGSWATALAVFPEIASVQRVILANDSLLGPFAPLSTMIADFEQSSSDVWGATDTTEYFPHLQSYLLGFTGGVLAHRAVRSFWRHIRVIADKDAIVVRYEIGLSRVAGKGRLPESSMVPSRPNRPRGRKSDDCRRLSPPGRWIPLRQENPHREPGCVSRRRSRDCLRARAIRTRPG